MGIRFVYLLVLASALAEQDADEQCDVESTAASVMMLQQTLSVQSAAKTVQTLTPAERMQAATPVFFMHLPKTAGTSFFNAIFALPGVCLGDEPPILPSIEVLLSEPPLMQTIVESCPGFTYDGAHAHPCLQPLLPAERGHLFGLFRQPEQRLLSLRSYLTSRNQTVDPDVADARVFFEHARGGMVYQLTHDDPNESFCTRNSADHGVVTDADVVEAVRVIQEDFAFVGIVEHWDMSICLMHAMFGGDCTADEFMNANPGRDHETGEAQRSDYDVTVLEGAVDTHDRILYEEALRIFQRNLEDLGVTEESCEQGCWSTARR